ncbi:MAG: hypothetical protein GC162_10010 [Planctomycetes bacterium]|nr:hypothetical protein [Planctomycetota bacterium]
MMLAGGLFEEAERGGVGAGGFAVALQQGGDETDARLGALGEFVIRGGRMVGEERPAHAFKEHQLRPVKLLLQGVVVVGLADVNDGGEVDGRTVTGARDEFTDGDLKLAGAFGSLDDAHVGLDGASGGRERGGEGEHQTRKDADRKGGGVHVGIIPVRERGVAEECWELGVGSAEWKGSVGRPVFYSAPRTPRSAFPLRSQYRIPPPLHTPVYVLFPILPFAAVVKVVTPPGRWGRGRYHMTRSTSSSSSIEQRRHPRQALAAGYAGLRVRRSGRSRYSLSGHAYDISAGGMRFELDSALKTGEAVDVEVTLPGRDACVIHAAGRVVRMCDKDPVGPVSMGLAFTNLLENETLASYLTRAASVAGN